MFSQSVLTHTLTLLVLSHQLIHTNSLILSQSVPTLLVLHTHVIPDTLSQSVLTHTLTLLVLSHQLIHTLTPTLLQLFSLTHVIPDTLSLSVLTPLSHYHSHTTHTLTHTPYP